MLNRLRKAMDERDKGFTLIELLVVIIIIGILAAIAIPVFLNQRKKGVDASLKSDLKTMAIAQETYLTDNPNASGVAVSTATTPTVSIGTEKFTSSPGNVIVVTLKDGGGYCIKGHNEAASTAKAPESAMTYDSLAGGLGQKGGACPAA